MSVCVCGRVCEFIVCLCELMCLFMCELMCLFVCVNVCMYEFRVCVEYNNIIIF